jgi:hypothetical protein
MTMMKTKKKKQPLRVFKFCLILLRRNSIEIFKNFLLGYTTPLDVENCEIDEYIIFKQVLEEVQGTNPGWYNALTGALTGDQQKALNDVIVLADQRRAAAESKRIEEAGGKNFLDLC